MIVGGSTTEMFVGTSWQFRVQHQFRTLLRFVQTKPLAAFGAFLVIFMIALAVFPNQIAPHEPDRPNLGARYGAPTSEFLAGTDQLGRDVLSRTIHGAQVSVRIGILSVLIGKTIALVVGMMSAYFGGVVDLLVQRLVDVLIAFPGLILAMFWVTLFDPGPWTVTFAIAVGLLPGSVRVVRSQVLAIREYTYVEAARAIGASSSRILLRHVFPNVTALFIVIFSLSVGGAIITESSLSFLGIGISQDIPTWGNMVRAGTRNLFIAGWWLPIPPSVALALTVYGFNLLGDGLRDVLDPRLRGSRAGGTRL